jgi:hypothetical protein
MQNIYGMQDISLDLLNVIVGTIISRYIMIHIKEHLGIVLDA